MISFAAPTTPNAPSWLAGFLQKGRLAACRFASQFDNRPACIARSNQMDARRKGADGPRRARAHSSPPRAAGKSEPLPKPLTPMPLPLPTPPPAPASSITSFREAVNCYVSLMTNTYTCELERETTTSRLARPIRPGSWAAWHRPAMPMRCDRERLSCSARLIDGPRRGAREVNADADVNGEPSAKAAAAGMSHASGLIARPTPAD